MGFIPLFIEMEGRRCLVIGGGAVAQRKCESLLSAGACLTVISPTLVPALRQARDAGRLTHVERCYQPGDLSGYGIIYCAVNDPDLGRQIHAEARRLEVLVNVADQLECCTFIVPAVARRGRLQVAVSTAGASPTLAARLRTRIAAQLSPELEVMVEIMAAARDWLKRNEPRPQERARKLAALHDGDLEAALVRGDTQAAAEIVERSLEATLPWVEIGLAPASVACIPRVKP
ncbi:MAG TPA: bifunctional precorrin-2 dehydrogenase/sirohydrochlorin ferrochelatase [Candidatus Binataceae bacterium]|nr:bifunctional precorrin-2 dehydrogenase/sirohydrochlorin ferrochelatase [Candidatus Binataceae bacterium]